MTHNCPSATDTVARIERGEITAAAATKAALASINARNSQFNAFTRVWRDDAMRAAEAVDEKVQAGHSPGPLAGVPFGVKDLYDVAGHITTAGAKIHAERPPAATTATVVDRLQKAGAVLLGGLNMEEYAYGFFTDNAHFGRTLNPHDPKRTAGGSSGGSAAAVAAGLVPFSLGSDTNGSIRVPAAFCGVFGLKPTFGRLSRAGTTLFVSSFDHVGPFARTAEDLALVYDVMQGYDAADPVCHDVAVQRALPELPKGIEGMCFALPGGYFSTVLDAPSRAALDRVAGALDAQPLEMPECMDAARAAAYVITCVEAMNERRLELAARPSDFDPATRYRFLAGALMPGAWYANAQVFRRWFAGQARRWFEQHDVLVLPVSPIRAPRFGQSEAQIEGSNLPIRLLLARFVQPLALLGYPIVVVPVMMEDGLPAGVQLMARPYEEDKLLRAAHWLERNGIVSCVSPRASGTS